MCLYVGYKSEVFQVGAAATECVAVVRAARPAKWLKFGEIGVLERSPSLGIGPWHHSWQCGLH